MDSKLLYSVSEAVKHKIVWNKVANDSEWIYFGESGQVNKRMVLESIQTYFTNNRFYIVCTRQYSLEISQDNIESAMEELLGIQNFLIWDISFERVIEFNHIGVLRKGRVNK